MKKIKRPIRSQRGFTILETGLVIALNLALIFGALEYAWHLHVDTSLYGAAREGARIASVQHRNSGAIGPGQSTSIPSLPPSTAALAAEVTAATQLYLKGLGFSSAFVGDVTAEIAPLAFTDGAGTNIASVGAALGSLPLASVDRAVAVKVSVPRGRAMVLGNIAARLLGFATGSTTDVSRVATQRWY